MEDKDQEPEPIQEIFVPGFLPPPISKDWERSFYTPNLADRHYFPHENAKLLNAQHFFLHDEHKDAA